MISLISRDNLLIIVHWYLTPLRGRGRSRQARASRADPGDDVVTTSISSVHGHLTDVSLPSIREIGAELLALLETALDRVGSHGTKAVICVARVRLGALLTLGHLGKVTAALDGVNEDEA